MRWFLVFYLFSFANASGQTNLIETLRKKVYEAATEEQKLNALVQLFDEYQSINRDTLDEYGPMVKALGDKSENPRLKSLSALAYANWYFRWGWSDSALVFIEPEINMNPVGNPQTRHIYFKLLRAKALYLGSKSRYAEALDVLYGILPQAEKYKDTLTLGLALNTIGSVAMGRGQPNEALSWTQKAIAISGNHDIRNEILAPAFLNAANAHANLGNLDSAEYYVMKALPLSNNIENLNYTATGLRILSHIDTQKGKYKAAEEALIEMMAVRRKTSPASILVEDNLELANFYANTNQLDKAIQICLQNLRKGALNNITNDSALILTNDPKLRLSFLEALAGYYRQAGNSKDYISALEELVASKDSFYEANSAQIIGELQTRYEVQAKENTILKQQYDIQRKNFLFYGTLFFVGLLVLGSVVRFNAYRKKQQMKAKAMIEEERRLSTEAVKKAEEKERVRIASDLHDNLGAYAASMSANISYLHLPEANAEIQGALQELNNNASAIVSQLNDTIWVLKKDALPLTAISDRIKKFIQMLERSYPGIRVDVNEEITNDISLTSSQAFHLYRILQEGLNNALKHSKAEHITVNVSSNEQQWMVDISDDGIGLPPEGERHAGFGLQNMKVRAKENGWGLHWAKNDSGGTTVRILPTTN
jgi:signal transduction histidine kinase